MPSTGVHHYYTPPSSSAQCQTELWENRYISLNGSQRGICVGRSGRFALFCSVGQRIGCRAFWCGGVILGSPYPNSTCRAARASVKGSSQQHTDTESSCVEERGGGSRPIKQNSRLATRLPCLGLIFDCSNFKLCGNKIVADRFSRPGASKAEKEAVKGFDRG